jgi:integrase
VFTDGDVTDPPPSPLKAFSRLVHNAGVTPIRFHDLRHTHGSLLIKEGVPVKVVSARLGHATSPTIQTYQHLLPDMQADTANVTERLARPASSGARERRGNTRKKSA